MVVPATIAGSGVPAVSQRGAGGKFTLRITGAVVSATSSSQR